MTAKKGTLWPVSHRVISSKSNIVIYTTVYPKINSNLKWEKQLSKVSHFFNNILIFDDF
jgi:hypothetical protein